MFSTNRHPGQSRSPRLSALPNPVQSPQGIKRPCLQRRIRLQNDPWRGRSNSPDKVPPAPDNDGTNVSERNISRAKLAERYKSVMLANHPDRGGSPYLALKINEARRVLNEFAR